MAEFDPQNALITLLSLAAQFPVTLFFAFLFAWFYPYGFARGMQYILAALALWGLYSNFENNFYWYLDTLNRFGWLDVPGDTMGAHERHNYAKGIYHAITLSVALGIIALPLFTRRSRARQ